MDYVKQILGEADEDEPKKKEKPEKAEKGKSEPAPQPAPKEGAAPSEDAARDPEEQEIKELASLWTTGNKDDLLRRFMEMDNETAVKVVFAIGREGAIELARMADQEAVAGEGSEEPGAVSPEGQGEATTEPASVEGPGQEDFSVRDITGVNNTPELEEPHLQQFRRDRSASPEGEGVRQALGRNFFKGLNPMG